MKIAGIIAEYNPFHSGHAYHIAETKRRSGAEGVICVMSGPFVQRGEPALLDKYVRAEQAVRGGADLVLELPPEYATASAEGFARGGIALLSACGCVNCLSFGAETDDLAGLSEAARLLAEDEALTLAAKGYMKEGASYAKAFGRVMEERDPALAELIRQPNNMLAVEYLKALRAQQSGKISPLVVKRCGAAYHDTETPAGGEDHPSAAAIRKAVLSADRSSLPETMKAALSPEAMMPLLMAKLRTLRYTGADLTAYEDVSPDLAARILAAVPYTESWEAFCGRIVTRNLTLARVRRALTHILLEIRDGSSHLAPSYLKVLALREGSPAVSAIAQNAALPRITKAADDRQDLAASSRFAQDLYRQMVFVRCGIALPDDYHKSPVILREDG